MAHQIKILTVSDSENLNEMSTVRTEMSDSERSGAIVQAMSVDRERAQRLKQEIGKPMSFAEFFDVMIDPIFKW
jgi:hypothetical protein